jgi:hypothetical protein
MADRERRRGLLAPVPRAWPHAAVRTRVNAAALRVANLGVRHAVRRLPEVLDEGETVEMLATGTYGRGTGVLALTDRRLVFYGHGLLTRTVEDVPYDRISSLPKSGHNLLYTPMTGEIEVLEVIPLPCAFHSISSNVDATHAPIQSPNDMIHLRSEERRIGKE